MKPPGFYRQACFSVAEAASILEIQEDLFRAWHARSCTKYVGVKTGHRLWFSAHDLYFFALARDMIAFGVPVRTAMFQAEILADETETYAPIRDEALVVNLAGDKTEMRRMSSYCLGDIAASHLHMPLATIWQRVVDRAAEAFAKEAA